MSWDKALAVAERGDRVCLRTTHHKYAKYLESVGDLDHTIFHYKRVGTHHAEVVRLFLNYSVTDKVERYANAKNDPELF